MPQTYVTVLFDDPARAPEAERVLWTIPGIRVHRAFLIRRGPDGYHVDGRDHGEAPKIDTEHFLPPLEMLGTVFARLLRGASREEDAVAVDDAEASLAPGGVGLVALIDEHDPHPLDQAMRALSGSVTRAVSTMLDAEDTHRFLDASSLSTREPGTPS